MPAYRRFIALIHAFVRQVSIRCRARGRNKTMRHNHDFDLGSSAYLISDEVIRTRPGDGSRAPRGLLLGIVLGLGLWVALIAGVLTLR